MSEQTNENPGGEGGEDLQVDQLSLLKQRARMMGITFSNNIGIEALQEKIEAKMNEDTEQANLSSPSAMPAAQASSSVSEEAQPEVPEAAPVKKRTLRQMVLEENMRLVRIRVTNLDPKKKEWPGEILTVANEHLGTVSKFVPFGEATDNGYHVPYCIYKMLKARKFLSIRTYRDRSNNNQIKVEQRWANEFAIDVLPPLTPDELAKLAASQIASGSVN